MTSWRTTWITRPARDAGLPEAGQRPSPTLLFHKWHGYDVGEARSDRRGHGARAEPTFKDDTARPVFLGRVQEAVQSALQGEPLSYTHWLTHRYLPALRALGADFAGATTLWRLVAGFAANPALETGLELHRFFGVPMVPGSAVKGLVHHVAEDTTVTDTPVAAWFGDEGEYLAPAPAALSDALPALLAAATRVWALFGSLTVERHPSDADGPPAPPTPRGLLRRLLEDFGNFERELAPFRPAIGALLDTHTGGRLTFFDAVPAAGERDLLDLDLLNPHYPEFYRDPEAHPPSDDQNPTPILFLAVAPGKKFLFPSRLRAALPAESLPEALRPYRVDETDDALRAWLHNWLATALTTWGAGAKTAAGYGIFRDIARQPQPA